ncbi:MAG: response regulator [Tannerella sp.]|jgi:DNA-binding response OmpR family regulator|nr:response regulator [Tannerella sp.]
MKKKILYLEDKDTVVKIVCAYLSEYEVYCFENPLKALSWLEEGNIPDLILSDLNMPEMNGKDFLFYIKSRDVYEKIPFVILSGESNSSIRIELLQQGAEDFISKPFNPVELKVRVDKYLKTSTQDVAKNGY